MKCKQRVVSNELMDQLILSDEDSALQGYGLLNHYLKLPLRAADRANPATFNSHLKHDDEKIQVLVYSAVAVKHFKYY